MRAGQSGTKGQAERKADFASKGENRRQGISLMERVDGVGGNGAQHMARKGKKKKRVLTGKKLSGDGDGWAIAGSLLIKNRNALSLISPGKETTGP